MACVVREGEGGTCAFEGSEISENHGWLYRTFINGRVNAHDEALEREKDESPKRDKAATLDFHFSSRSRAQVVGSGHVGDCNLYQESRIGQRPGCE
jgi:hypothetical protein